MFPPVQVVGIIFPLPILLMVPLRRFLLPRFFDPVHLHALDPAPYDAASEPVDESVGPNPPLELSLGGESA